MKVKALPSKVAIDNLDMNEEGSVSLSPSLSSVRKDSPSLSGQCLPSVRQ